MEQNMLDAHRMQAEGKKQRDIAEHFGVTTRTIRNWLAEKPRPRKKAVRVSKVAPYYPLIRTILNDDPEFNGELILERMRNSGYGGGKTIAKGYMKTVRDELRMRAVIRFETEPGFQAQVDWIELGKQGVDGRRVKLYAFVMLLGYSRHPFVKFTTNMKSSTLLACHLEAFQYFGGVPKEILYDNMKTAWYYDGEVWRPNLKLSRFACDYGFIPRRCQVRRPETKGKVERFNQYLEGNFWASQKEKSLSINGLNTDVKQWIRAIENRAIGGLNESRKERFEREQKTLAPVPEISHDVREAIPVMVNRESCITWQTNKYSVPPRYLGQTLTLRPAVFDNTADIYAEGTLIKTLALEGSGTHKTIIDAEDRKLIQQAWEKHRAKQQHMRLPKKQRQSDIEVSIRSPSFYEMLLTGVVV